MITPNRGPNKHLQDLSESVNAGLNELKDLTKGKQNIGSASHFMWLFVSSFQLSHINHNGTWQSLNKNDEQNDFCHQIKTDIIIPKCFGGGTHNNPYMNAIRYLFKTDEVDLSAFRRSDILMCRRMINVSVDDSLFRKNMSTQYDVVFPELTETKIDTLLSTWCENSNSIIKDGQFEAIVDLSCEWLKNIFFVRPFESCNIVMAIILANVPLMAYGVPFFVPLVDSTHESFVELIKVMLTRDSSIIKMHILKQIHTRLENYLCNLKLA
jgi:hypothetical protein